MSNHKKIILVLLSFIGIYFGIDCLREWTPFGIRINLTASLPYTCFLCGFSQEIKRNDYVSFDHPSNENPLLKVVIGLPGDLIEREGDRLRVNQVDLGRILPNTPSGKSLQSIKCSSVPEEHVFVYATHPESFDSRYEEFGFIKIQDIKEKLWPLF